MPPTLEHIPLTVARRFVEVGLAVVIPADDYFIGEALRHLPATYHAGDIEQAETATLEVAIAAGDASDDALEIPATYTHVFLHELFKAHQQRQSL